MCLLGMLSGVSCAPWCNGNGSAPLPLPPSCFAPGRNFWVVMPLFQAYLGLVACPGCSCLPWEEGGSQDLPFGEPLTPISTGCTQETFAEVLGANPTSWRRSLMERGRLRLRFHSLVKYFIWLS